MSKWKCFEELLVGRSEPDQYSQEQCTWTLSSEMSGVELYPLSLSRMARGGGAMAGKEHGRRRLAVITGRRQSIPDLGQAPVAEFRREDLRFSFFDATSEAVLELGRSLPWLRPRTNPGGASIGLGDRWGLATPAHVRAVEASGMFPVFAQQTVVENESTGRGWTEVLADAVFGVFREGYRHGYGADADHLSDPEQIAAAASAGYVRFSLDLTGLAPGTRGLDRKELARRFVVLENDVPGAAMWRKRYLGKDFTVGSGKSRVSVMFDEKAFFSTAIRMGPVLEKARSLIRAVMQACRGKVYQVELSLDESAEPTSLHEHIFLALELAEEGLPLHALAPRFIGELQKGLDYMGNSSKFARDMARHAGVAKLAQGHQIVLHSAGDKFSLLPRVGDATEGNFHVKMSGTSFVEGLRTVARTDRTLFQEVADAALASFSQLKQPYRIEIEPTFLPSPGRLTPEELEEVWFDSRYGRQLLYLSHNAIFRGPRDLKSRLIRHLHDCEDLHFELVETHIARHVKLLKG